MNGQPNLKADRKAFLLDLLAKTVVPLLVAFIGVGTFKGCVHTGEWQNINLGNGWDQEKDHERVGYMKDAAGIVHFRGAAVFNGSGVSINGPLNTTDLPDDVLPEHVVQGVILKGNSAATEGACSISVFPTGKIGFNGCVAVVYLDGFSYPAKAAKIN